MEKIELLNRFSDSNRAAHRHLHPPPVGSKRILVAQPDKDYRAWLGTQLALVGEFIVIEADSCEKALGLAGSETADAMVVDIDLPELGGHEFCRLVRRYSLPVPIILLSRREWSDAEEILSLDAGANDFLAGTFTLSVLLARLRARFRDFEQAEAAAVGIGPYRFEPAKRLLTDSETQRRVRLTSKEAGILKYLYRRAGTFTSREALLREVWSVDVGRGINTHTVEATIYRLRQKIERHPQKPAILITEAGGYRLATTSVNTEGRQALLLQRAS